MGRGRGPRKTPGAPAYTLGADLGRESEDASPPALRPVKPLSWRHLQSLPRTLCLLPKPLDAENSAPCRCLSRRSPLRSMGCTAAPEGQTKFGFGKRAPGVILEFLGRCTDSGKPRQPSVSGGRPPSTRRTYPVGGVRAAVPSERRPGRRGSLWKRKGPRNQTCPGLSLNAQIPEKPAPRRRPPSSKGARGNPGSGRSPAEKGSELESRPSGSHLGSFRQHFLFPVFYSPNPISPTSQNERVRENAQIEVCENKVAQVNQLVVV